MLHTNRIWQVSDAADVDDIDQSLAGLCPHDPGHWFLTWADSDEQLATCANCGVSWYTGKCS